MNNLLISLDIISEIADYNTCTFFVHVYIWMIAYTDLVQAFP
jgi:hypothetical protein